MLSRWRDDSQARLAQVERSNLFLPSLDEERRWYRYHHLFAEVLHTRLRQTHPALVPELHRRACRWFEQHQLFDEAIIHALAISDIERSARLIEQYACLIYMLWSLNNAWRLVVQASEEES